MKIELKKISYSKSLSEETNAYTAQVWVDDVHVCDVSNHGQGGCDEQHPAKGKTHKDVAALNDAIKAERGKEKTEFTHDGKPFYIDVDLEHVCGDLLEKHLVEKTLRRDLTNKILFQKPGKPGIYEVKKPKGPVDQTPKLIAIIKEKHQCATTLNEMPFDEALKIYRAA